MGDVSDPVYHARAKCRWCGSRFVKSDWIWLCETPACAARQLARAVKPGGSSADSPNNLFVPLPMQVDTDVIPTKFLLVWGPAGISKTKGGRWSAYSLCREMPGCRVLLLRCTYDQLEKTHLQFMTSEAKRLGDAKYYAGNPKRLVFEDIDSELRFGYCEHEADIDQHMGPEWDLIIFEEANQFLPKALNKISSRARGSDTSRQSRDKMVGWDEGRVRYLTNPGGRGWMYLEDFCIDKKPDRDEYPTYDPQYYGHITGDISDNPYLSATFEESSLGGLDNATYQQLAKGRRDIFPGQFFSGFNPAVHVKDTL